MMTLMHLFYMLSKWLGPYVPERWKIVLGSVFSVVVLLTIVFLWLIEIYRLIGSKQNCEANSIKNALNVPYSSSHFTWAPRSEASSASQQVREAVTARSGLASGFLAVFTH